MKETHSEAAEPFFTDLVFSGEKLPYDETTSTFYLPLDMETEAWEGGELSALAGDTELLFEEKLTDSDKQEAIRTREKISFLCGKGERIPGV